MKSLCEIKDSFWLADLAEMKPLSSKKKNVN